MPRCLIKRYAQGKTDDCEIILPGHPTITGRENHFALAAHDAGMLIQGMEAAERVSNPTDDKARYWVHSVSLD